MENELFKYVITQGIFCALFVHLLLYILKENSIRECNYQSLINKLTEKFNIVEDVKRDVENIKNKESVRLI